MITFVSKSWQSLGELGRYLCISCSKCYIMTDTINHLQKTVVVWQLCFPLSPEAADSTSFDVQLGDIILTATDGLFDNMPDYMILQELRKIKVLLWAFDNHNFVDISFSVVRKGGNIAYSVLEHQLWEHPADSQEHCRTGPCFGIWPQLYVTFCTVCLWQWTECKR